MDLGSFGQLLGLRTPPEKRVGDLFYLTRIAFSSVGWRHDTEDDYLLLAARVLLDDQFFSGYLQAPGLAYALHAAVNEGKCGLGDDAKIHDHQPQKGDIEARLLNWAMMVEYLVQYYSGPHGGNYIAKVIVREKPQYAKWVRRGFIEQKAYSRATECKDMVSHFLYTKSDGSKQARAVTESYKAILESKEPVVYADYANYFQS